MKRWTPDGLLACDNCDNPASKALAGEGICLCAACCFGESEAFIEQMEAGDVVRRLGK